jgi:hypothetical protein
MQEVIIDAADRHDVQARVRRPRGPQMWSIATVRDRNVYRVQTFGCKKTEKRIGSMRLAVSCKILSARAADILKLDNGSVKSY